MSETQSDLAKRLVERRANIWEQAKAVLDTAETEKRELSGEEEAKYAALNDDLNALDQRVKDIADTEQRGRDTEAAMARILDTPKTEPSKSDELRAFFAGERGKRFDVAVPEGYEQRVTLSKLTAAAGLNTVKTSFYEKLVEHMIEVSGVLRAGPTVLNTGTGEQIQVPKTTAHSTAALIAEAASITASEPTFGQVPLDAYKYAFLMQVSTELLTDTSVDLESYLSRQAGRALGNGLGVHLVTGSGSSQPNGVVTASTLGVTGALSTVGVFTADNLIDLHYSVIEPYRNSESCAWMFRDATLASVRKLKDSQNRYLFEPSLVAGTPDTLLGKKIVTDPNVAAQALSAKSVLFGDFSAYFVRLAGGIRFERSDDYAFNTDLTTFRAILRGDGDLIDTTGAVKHFIGGAS